MDVDALKAAAARAAVEREVRSGMRLGLGSGTTVVHVLDALGEALAAGRIEGIVGVPTSLETERRARVLAIPIVELHEGAPLDVTLDGADEIDPQLDLIKGRGGALLREKMVAQATERLVIVADSTKQVTQLGSQMPVPIEVVPFGWRSHIAFLEWLGATVERRAVGDEVLVTDNRNYILDARWADGIDDPRTLEWLLLARAGIVDHGLFLDMAQVAYVASEQGVERLERPKEE